MDRISGSNRWVLIQPSNAFISGAAWAKLKSNGLLMEEETGLKSDPLAAASRFMSL